MAQQADIMVVAAHPDDPEFGVGGTVARLVQRGKSVVYVVCTSGEKGTSDRTMKPEVLAKIREQEETAAAKVLGVREVVFLRHLDQTLEDTPEFRKEIVRVIRMFRPEIVLTTNPYRRYLWHRDHRIAAQVTLDAVYPFARDYLAYPDLVEQGFEPHKVQEVWLWGAEDDINFRSDITSTWEKKLAALRCHKSQMGQNFAQMEARLRQRAENMAQGTDFKLAEAFHRVESIW